MFLNKQTPVNVGDTGATVNEGMGVNSLQGVQWFNKLDRDLHRWANFT